MENNRLTIVAIDDNKDNLVVLKAFMKDAFPDATVFTATDGKSGIRLALEKNPDVILLDILMPGMDGYDVCTELKNDPRLLHIPVVFLTALKDDRKSRIRALESGGDGFITKPFEEAELIAQIRAMVKIKAANEQKQQEKEKLTVLVEKRTSQLEKELAEHKKTGQELIKVNRALEQNKTALLNLLEDLNAEIEARKKNEMALTDSEAFLSDIINTQPAGVYRVRVKPNQPFINEEQLNVTYDFISNQYCELTGRSRGELEADPLITIHLIHPDDVSEFIEVNQKAVLSMTRFVWEGRMIVNGQTLWVRFESIPRIGTNGDKLWTGVLIDITGRKLAEDTLIRVNQKLNVLSDLTRKDLSSQIFVLRSYVELAKKNATGHVPVLEILQKIERVVKSINDISEISKDYQDMGTKPPSWQNVNMALLFGLSHISIGEIQHTLETENLEIFADPLLEKAFQGIFENSIAHGGQVSRIRISHTETPTGVVLCYEDDGVGISEEKKERIFLRGEGVRTAMRGLFFVREILDITNITIKETGEPGKGARFEMTVPKGGFRFGNEPK
jgi:PAS domain S-box-containing protein